jgi:hypothetical protein
VEQWQPDLLEELFVLGDHGKLIDREALSDLLSRYGNSTFTNAPVHVSDGQFKRLVPQRVAVPKRPKRGRLGLSRVGGAQVLPNRA